MTYGRKHNKEKVFKPNYLRTSARRDLCSHPSILISNITTRSFTWCIINFYNDMDDISAINTLLSLDIDPTIPTLLAGDFNAYGTTWYDMFDGPAPTSIQRKSGTRIEAWALALFSWPSHTQGGEQSEGQHPQPGLGQPNSLGKRCFQTTLLLLGRIPSLQPHTHSHPLLHPTQNSSNTHRQTEWVSYQHFP